MANVRMLTMVEVDRISARFHHQATLRMLLYSCGSLTNHDLDHLLFWVNTR